MKSQTHTATHIAEQCEKRGGSGALKMFPDLLIFDEKRLKTLVLQRIETGMGFIIGRSHVQVTFPVPKRLLIVR